MTPPLIVVTQGEGEDGEGSLASVLLALGAEVLSLPTISIQAPDDCRALDRALADVVTIDWVVFTSRHAVNVVSARPAWSDVTSHTWRPRIAAIGDATAARLREMGASVDLTPVGASVTALASALIEDRRRAGFGNDLEGMRIVWPRSDIARPELGAALRAAGAVVVDPVAYRTVPVRVGDGNSRESSLAAARVREFLRCLDTGTIAAVTFMSPSSARNLAAMFAWDDLSPLDGRAAIASIGPTTSDTLREMRVSVDVESRGRTAEDLATSLLGWLQEVAR